MHIGSGRGSCQTKVRRGTTCIVRDCSEQVRTTLSSGDIKCIALSRHPVPKHHPVQIWIDDRISVSVFELTQERASNRIKCIDHPVARITYQNVAAERAEGLAGLHYS